MPVFAAPMTSIVILLHMQEVKKSALPPSVANASHGELQRVLVETLKKLKARDRKIAELTAALGKAEGNHAEPPAEQANGQDRAVLEEQLQVALPSFNVHLIRTACVQLLS